MQNQSEFRVELHQAEGVYQILSLQWLWNCDSALPEKSQAHKEIPFVGIKGSICYTEPV